MKLNQSTVMECEVLKDPSEGISLAKARRREKLIVMSPEEGEIFCEHPNGKSAVERPGYPDPTYGGIE